MTSTGVESGRGSAPPQYKIKYIKIYDITNRLELNLSVFSDDLSRLCLCIDAGQTTPAVNHSDGSLSLIPSRHAERTTDATLYNATTMSSSSATLSNTVLKRNESNVTNDATGVMPHYLEICPSRVHCAKLGADCIDCEFNWTCRYGSNVSAACHAKPQIICLVCARLYVHCTIDSHCHLSNCSEFHFFCLFFILFLF